MRYMSGNSPNTLGLGFGAFRSVDRYYEEEPSP